MEVNIWLALGLIGGVILALAISGYFGNALGTTMNSFKSGTGDFVLGISNWFFGLAIVIALVVVAIAIIYAYQQTQS